MGSLGRGRNRFVLITCLVAFFLAVVSSAAAAGAVLYDQDPGLASGGDGSDTLPPADRTADDFLVPEGAQWTLTQIDVFGSSASATPLPSSFNVAVFADGGGYPGTQIADAPGRFYSPPTDAGTGSDWLIELPSITLPPGHYWISVQAVARGTNDWYWDLGPSVSNTSAARECDNVPGGWSSSTGTPSGCAGSTPYDVQFRLHGSSAPYSPPQQQSQQQPPPQPQQQTTPPLITAPFAGMTLTTQTINVGKNGKVTIAETCPSAAVGNCVGTDTLKTAGKVTLKLVAARKKAKILTLGKTSFSIPAGTTKKVTIKLSKSALKLLGKKHKIKARQTVVSHDSRNTPKTTVGTVTLKK